MASNAVSEANSFALEENQVASTHDTIIILDFGSQYSHLIARRIREANVYCELQSCLVDVKYLEKFGSRLKGIIFSGGPHSVYEEGAPHPANEIFTFLSDKNIPLLGICYGLQQIAYTAGGEVAASEKREYGFATVKVNENDANCSNELFDGVAKNGQFQVWMSHGDKLKNLPSGFSVIGSSDNSPFAAIANESKKQYGIQFHPEVTHTPQGGKLLRNFVVKICGCETKWTMTNLVQQMMYNIKKQVGEDGVVIGAVSGGVDSTVAAVLMTKAIGHRFHAILVDNGLLRKNEAEEVLDRLNNKCGVNVRCVNAVDLFLNKLEGVSEPEKKRKVIGHTFIEVFEAEAKKIDNAKFLLQGTLYPDVIESVSYKGPSATIKTHHNVGGLPERMDMELIEPLRLFFKDEVRALGLEMGIEPNSIWRHPFPGPGLAIRMLGDVHREGLEMLRAADNIFIEEIRAAGIYQDIGQAFAVLLPCKSVGVMGDGRTYEKVIALRAVQTSDFMTADWYQMPYEVLGKASTRIINEVKGINRVCYDVSSKPPATIEWE
jgi:GMP synthase (glutamine-hydrolysing)